VDLPEDRLDDRLASCVDRPALTDQQATELRARATAGDPKAALATAFGVSRQTVYSYLRPSASD